MKKQLSDMTVVEIFALGTSMELIRFIQKEYNCPDFNVRVRLDFSRRRKKSWGGRRNGGNFISLAMHRYAEAQEQKMPVTFYEYASYANDKEIGAIENTNWKHALTALICHEMAHAAQFSKVSETIIAANNIGPEDQRNKHGLVFKTIYRTLRNKYCNGKFSTVV